VKRLLCAVVLASFGVLTVAAQVPGGWKQRLDRSTSASDPDAAGAVKFVSAGGGFHATTPQAAVFWNPANVATGVFTAKASFRLMKPSDHTNYYGLVFAGSDLEGPRQAYIYFMVAQDGTWLLKRRDGDASATTLANKTVNSVVNKPGADGTSVNDLEVRVLANKIEYVVNGTVVHATPKMFMTAKTDGLVGLRVNHLLDVQVDRFSVSTP